MELILKTALIYLAALSLITFIVYGIDKFKAKANLWRIPEKVLILLAFLGGATGALAGMAVFRHKTKKLKFRILVPLALIFNAACLIGLVILFEWIIR